MMGWSSTINFYWYLLDLTACSRVVWQWMGVGCFGLLLWHDSAITVSVYMDGAVIDLL